MERKKRSKGREWESCYVKKIYGTFGVEMRAYGQKFVKFCTHTHAAKLVVEMPGRRTQHTIMETIPVQFLQQGKYHDILGWRVETTTIQI